MPTKDPDAVLDYAIDWGRLWLPTDDTIVSATWIVPDGINKVSDNIDGGRTVVWLSGGTPGTLYELTCRVVTAEARTETATLPIYVDN